MAIESIPLQAIGKTQPIIAQTFVHAFIQPTPEPTRLSPVIGRSPLAPAESIPDTGAEELNNRWPARS